MILIDNNQIMIACIFQAMKNNETEMSVFRHLVLNSYRMYRKRFHKEYGELVICNDTKNYWRKDIFPDYKLNRKNKMKKSSIDWDHAFSMLNSLMKELEEVLPYKIVQVDRTEADDVIAILSRVSLDEKVMIVSSDKDFQQLLKYPNVNQYSPFKKEFIVCDDPERFLIEHIIRGDYSDGIPNILSDDDAIINEEKRQTPCRSKKIEEIFQNLGEWSQKEEWKRNQTLIDLDFIPEQYESAILEAYQKEPKGKRSKLLNYFIEHRLKNLMEYIEEF